MSNIFGGGAPKGGYTVTGGGTGAPWNWGVSPYDQSAINAAVGDDTAATSARYNQLGLGGSTMEGQDLGTLPSQTGGIAGEGEAMTGQLQTQNVGNPALNPALQPQLNQYISNPGGSSSLSSLAGAAGLGGLAGAGTGAAANSTDVGSLFSGGVLG